MSFNRTNIRAIKSSVFVHVSHVKDIIRYDQVVFLLCVHTVLTGDSTWLFVYLTHVNYST